VTGRQRRAGRRGDRAGAQVGGGDLGPLVGELRHLLVERAHLVEHRLRARRHGVAAGVEVRQVLLGGLALVGDLPDGAVVGEQQGGALLLVDRLADPQVRLRGGVRAGDRLLLGVVAVLEAQHLPAGRHLDGERVAHLVRFAAQYPGRGVDDVVAQRHAVLGGHVDDPVRAAGRVGERVGDHRAQHHDRGRGVGGREEEQISHHGQRDGRGGGEHDAPPAQRDPDDVREADDALPVGGNGICDIHGYLSPTGCAAAVRAGRRGRGDASPAAGAPPA
jgi:hypothetical protein